MGGARDFRVKNGAIPANASQCGSGHNPRPPVNLA
jgi:hypothetical protein